MERWNSAFDVMQLTIASKYLTWPEYDTLLKSLAKKHEIASDSLPHCLKPTPWRFYCHSPHATIEAFETIRTLAPTLKKETIFTNSAIARRDLVRMFNEHFDETWNFGVLSYCLPLEIIQSRPNIKWDVRGLAANPDITWEFAEARGLIGRPELLANNLYRARRRFVERCEERFFNAVKCVLVRAIPGDTADVVCSFLLVTR